MVHKRKQSLAQIRKQIGVQKLKIAKAKARDDLEMERRAAEMELKTLSRSASTKRNIVFARRTARGFKGLARAGGKLAVKQLKRIKDQQMRDEALERRIGKQRKKATKTIKKIRKGARKIKRDLPNDVFGGLDF